MNKELLYVIAPLGVALFTYLAKKDSIPTIEAPQNETLAVISAYNQRGYFNNYIDPALVMAMIKQESDFNVNAIRIEKGVKSKYSLFQDGDASIGLMQTLTSTAVWLHDDMGYIDVTKPTSDTLRRGVDSLYYGMAYIDYLIDRARKNGIDVTNYKLAEWYNGGYGNSNVMTKAHATKVMSYYNFYYNQGIR